LAAHRINQRFETERTSIEGFDGIFPQPLLLRSITEFTLLVVGEEREIVVVLRMSLRHFCDRSVILQKEGLGFWIFEDFRFWLGLIWVLSQSR